MHGRTGPKQGGTHPDQGGPFPHGVLKVAAHTHGKTVKASLIIIHLTSYVNIKLTHFCIIWVWWGFLITVIPLLIIGIIARAHYKINYCSIMGLLSGACTDPPALAYGNKVSGNDAPSVAYSTVYPLAMFLRVLSAQLLILLFY